MRAGAHITSLKMHLAAPCAAHATRGTAKVQPPEVEKSRCSDWPRRQLRRSSLELRVWIQLAAASDRPDARTGTSARKQRMSASVGHAHVHQRAKPACVRSRGWIPHHEHRCRSLTADPGAVLVNRKDARLRRPIVREALEALEPREKPVAAEGLHGDDLVLRGRFLRLQHRRRTLELN